MAIDKLNKTFVSEQVLEATEMNQITQKIDEVVQTINSSIGEGGTIVVDSEMSDSSTNPVQNKIIKKYVDERTNELNISVLYPTNGIDGSNKYDLATAIAQVPAQYRVAGLKVTFVNEDNVTESWEYGGGSWDNIHFKQVGSRRFLEVEKYINTGLSELEKEIGKQSISVIQGENSVRSISFTKERLELNQYVTFKLVCDNGIVEKYAIIDDKGVDIDAAGGLAYKFSPNKLYTVKIKDSFLSPQNINEKWGVFVNAANAVGNGEAVLYFDFFDNGALAETEKNKNAINSIQSQLLTISDKAEKGFEAYTELSTLNELPLNSGFITGGASGVWATSGTNRCIFLPLKNNGSIKIKANKNNTSIYTLLSDNTINAGSSPKFSDGLDRIVTIQADKEVELSYTEESKFLYVFQQEGGDRLPQSVIINGYDYALDFKDNISNVYKNTEKGVSAFETLNNDISSYPLIDGYIGVDKWFTSINTNKCILIPLEGSGKIKLTANKENSSSYALLSELNIANEATPLFSDRFNKAVSITTGSTAEFDYTNESKYLYLFQQTTSDRLPQNIYINDIDYKLSLVGNIAEIHKQLEEQSKGGAINVLYGKKLVTICDSLGIRGSWQSLIAKTYGMIFDKSSNDQISIGGTQTLDNSGNCGMDRSRKLKEFDIEPDYILYENINDGNRGEDKWGSKTDVPYFLTTTYNSATTYGSYTEAQNKDNLITEITSLVPKVGAMVNMNYSKNATKITVTKEADKNGNITIKIGSDPFNVAVTTDMTIEQIVDKIVEIDFSGEGYSDEKSGTNSVLFKPIGSTTDKEITTETNNTGVTFSTEKISSTTKVSFCFVSYNVSEWTDKSKWVLESDMTLWSILKGEIEYLYTNFPNARIFFAIFPRLAERWKDKGNASSKRADGSLDWDNYEFRDHWTKLYQLQRDVADYMQMPVIDVVRRSNINYYNGGEFYPDWNVHFSENGDKRIGETIGRELIT